MCLLLANWIICWALLYYENLYLRCHWFCRMITRLYQSTYRKWSQIFFANVFKRYSFSVLEGWLLLLVILAMKKKATTLRVICKYRCFGDGFVLMYFIVWFLIRTQSDDQMQRHCWTMFGFVNLGGIELMEGMELSGTLVVLLLLLACIQLFPIRMFSTLLR